MASKRVYIVQASTSQDTSGFIEFFRQPCVLADPRPRRAVPTTSSEPVIDQNVDPSTKLLASSQPKYAAIGVPVPASGQTIEPEVTEQVVDEPRKNRFKAFYEWYYNSAIKFRSSSFIHIFQLIIACIPISAIVMGLNFLNECPQASFLPHYVMFTGAVGLVLVLLWITHSYHEHCGTDLSKFLRILIALTCLVLLLLVAFETLFIRHMSISFDPTAHDYCNKKFYCYTFYKAEATVAAVILAAILYSPGSDLFSYWPYPASAFFSSRL